MKRKHYKNRKKVKQKRNQKLALFILVLFLGAFLIINYYGDNNLLEFISNSLLFQSSLLILALISLIEHFLPFNLRGELNIEEVKKISSNEFEKSLKDKKENEIIKKEASF
ncbi:hypothetical protein [Lacinutrix himadriensis]|uniref:hypothetical protein n=1 Tax=Lacinutrix himadriensis TaxID=641549 RepID=UPI0006E1495E|nr:hypothetical protein [Lacinutrix himadriensis]